MSNSNVELEESALKFQKRSWPMTDFHGIRKPGAENQKNPSSVAPATLPAAAELPSPLPVDINACYELLKQLHGPQNADAKALVRKHIFEIQQGLPTISITADHHAQIAVAKFTARATRAASLQNLNNVLAQPFDDTLDHDKLLATMLPNNGMNEMTEAELIAFDRSRLKAAPKDSLFNHALIDYLITFAKRAACELEKYEIENYSFLNAREALFELENELQNCGDTNHARELQSEIARLRSSFSSNNAENRGRHAPIQGQQSRLKDILLCRIKILIGECSRLLIEFQLDAQCVEREFFAEFSLPLKPTQLSLRYDSLRQELRKLTVSQQSLAWFGVRDVTEI